jgi:AraC-like DNA-binding protein
MLLCQVRGLLDHGHKSDGGRADHMTEEDCGKPLAYFHPVALSETEFIFAENCVRKWRVFHEGYVVCVCRKASAAVHYRGRLHQLTDASYMLMEPGETHVNTLVPRPQTYTVMRVSAAVIEQAAQELGLPRNPHFPRMLGSSPAIIQAFQRLASSVCAGDTALELQSRFALGLRLVLENCTEHARGSNVREAGGQRAPVERAKMCLRERFNEAMSLNELAEAAGLSRFHLLRTFAKQVGMPPHVYQVRLRIERACRLMQAGMLPSVAAMAVGFADQSHFTRHFRTVMDTTPGRYVNAAVAHARRNASRGTGVRG